MKKNAWILTLALLIALPVFGLAAGLATEPVDETQTTPPYGFTDADNNGICDICGNVPGMNAEGPNFLDSDGDGKCDHYGTDMQGQGAGQQGQGLGNQGASKGQSFVDADGNGECDNLGTQLQGQGQGQQSRGGGRGRK